MIKVRELYQMQKDIEDLKLNGGGGGDSCKAGLNPVEYNLTAIDWTLNQTTQLYEYMLIHNSDLHLKELTLKFYSENMSIDLSYEYMDKNKVKIFTDEVANVTIILHEKHIVPEVFSVDLTNYYTKDEIYNKTEIDEKFDGLETIDLTNYYNKQEIDTKFENTSSSSFEKDWGEVLINDFSTITETLAKNPNPRYGVAYATVGHCIYSICGRPANTNGTDGSTTVMCFNTKTKEWSEKANAPMTAYGCSASVNGTDIYVFAHYGGGSPNIGGKIAKYNTVSDTWSVIENSGKSIVWCGSGFANGKVYSVAGWSGALVGNISSFDIANGTAWVNELNISAQQMLGSTTIGTDIYFIGKDSPTKLIKYDTVANKVSDVTNSVQGNSGSRFNLCNDGINIYIIDNNTIYIFNTKTNQLSKHSCVPMGGRPITACINGSLYINAVDDGSNAGTMYRFNLASSLTEVSQAKATTSNINQYAGIEGQIVVNTDDHSIHVMDGITKGGHKMSTREYVDNRKEFLTDWGTYDGIKQTEIVFHEKYYQNLIDLSIDPNPYFYVHYRKKHMPNVEFISVGHLASVSGYKVEITGNHITEGNQEALNRDNLKDFSGSTKYFRCDAILADFVECETNNKEWAESLRAHGIDVTITSTNPPTCVEVSQLSISNELLKDYSGVPNQIVVNADTQDIYLMDGATKGGHKVGISETDKNQIEKNKVDIINMNQNISNHEKDWRDLGILDTKIIARQKTRIPSALGSVEYVNGYVSKPFIHEGKIYISEFSTYGTTNGLISYKPSTDTWEKAPFSLPFKPHSDGYGIAINGDIIHGIQRENHITYNIKTGETNTHTIENDIYHEWSDVVCVNKKLYGISDDNLAEYDIVSKTAKILKAIPQESAYVQAGFLLHDKNKLYIFSNSRAKYDSHIYEYDILTTNLRKVAFTDRAYHLPAIKDGEIILTGSAYDDSSPNSKIVRVNISTGEVVEENNILPINMHASATFNVDGIITAIDPMNGNVVSISSAKPPTAVKQARAKADELAKHTGVAGQLMVNTETNALHIMDGETAGGHSLFPMKKVTQAEYDAITTKHPSTLYIITD